MSKKLPLRKFRDEDDDDIPCFLCNKKIENGDKNARNAITIERDISELVFCDPCAKKYHNEERPVFILDLTHNIRIMNNELTFIKEAIKDQSFDHHELMVDLLNTWKYNNQLQVLQNTKNILKDNSIIIVPIKWIITLMEYVSLEGEDSIKMHWSYLLANMINGSTDMLSESYQTFIELFSKVSFIELIILRELYNNSFIKHENDLYSIKKSSAALSFLNPKSNIKQQAIDSKIAVDNLFQLNLIKDGLNGTDDDYIELTFLGVHLMHNITKLSS